MFVVKVGAKRFRHHKWPLSGRFLPRRGFCAGSLKNPVCVCPSRSSVRTSRSKMDHFWDPKITIMLGNMDLGGPESGHFRMSRSDVTLDVTLDHFGIQNGENC